MDPTPISTCATNEAHAHGLRSVWRGLLLAVVLDVAAQLCWKSAAGTAPPSAGVLAALGAAALHPLGLALPLIFAAQFYNWIAVLSRSDLSFAQPITALSYVPVAGLAALLFHEPLPPLRVLGIGLILCGVWVISTGSHLTARPEHGPRSGGSP